MEEAARLVEENIGEAWRVAEEFLSTRVGVHAVPLDEVEVALEPPAPSLLEAGAGVIAAYNMLDGRIYVYDVEGLRRDPVAALAEEILHMSTPWAPPGLSERLADCMLRLCRPREAYMHYPDYRLLAYRTGDEVLGIARYAARRGRDAAIAKTLLLTRWVRVAPGVVATAHTVATVFAMSMGYADVYGLLPARAYLSDDGFLIVFTGEPEHLREAGYHRLRGKAAVYEFDAAGRLQPTLRLPATLAVRPARLAPYSDPRVLDETLVRVARVLERDPAEALGMALEALGFFSDALPRGGLEHVARKAAWLARSRGGCG